MSKVLGFEDLKIARDLTTEIVEKLRTRFPDIWYQIKPMAVGDGEWVVEVEAKYNRKLTEGTYINTTKRSEIANKVIRITKKLIDHEIINVTRDFVIKN